MYWVADSQGRVLGPTQLDTLRELVGAGKLQDIAQVSRDGQSWLSAELVPEIGPLRATRTPEAVAASELEQLGRVREYLQRIQTLPVHELFGLPAGASLTEHRAAFFSTVKRFYPERYTHPELRRACENVFLYLASVMVNLERAERPAPITLPARELPLAPSQPLRITGRVTAPGRQLLARGAREPVTYEPAEFVGLGWAEDRLSARLRIRRKNVPMFSDHPLANFSSGSVFIPGTNVVPLGTLLDLTLHFEEPHAEIQTRGKVFWENSGNDPRQASGFGVRLFTLTPKDQDFIRAYIRGS